MAAQTVKDLACLMSECGASQFSARMAAVKNLQNIWSKGGEAIVLEVVSEPSQTESTITTIITRNEEIVTRYEEIGKFKIKFFLNFSLISIKY